MASRNVETVKGFWAVLQRDGLAASTEAMLSVSHPDVELAPYVAGGRVLRGADELREFFAEREAAGVTLHASPWKFEEDGDDVIVSGTVRVHRADGSLADAQVRWTYGFRDGRLARASFGPLSPAA